MNPMRVHLLHHVQFLLEKDVFQLSIGESEVELGLIIRI
jgi:hypothetical protein